MAQARFEDVVPCMVIYWVVAAQVAMGLHCVVPASFWKLVVPSQDVHCRSEERVGAVLCTVPTPQVETVRQLDWPARS